VATFDIVPTDEFFPSLFHLNEMGFQPLNERYEDFNMETQNFIMILGSIFLIFLLILTRLLFLGVTSLPLIRDVPSIISFRNKVTEGLAWNEVIEFLMGAYAEILFGICL
jgi:hypothetical protein